MPTDAQPMPRPTRSGLKVLAVGLLMLAPVLYVLSEGPAASLALHPTTETRLHVYRFVYAPLAWLSEDCAPIRHARGRYLWRWCTSAQLRLYSDCGDVTYLPNP